MLTIARCCRTAWKVPPATRLVYGVALGLVWVYWPTLVELASRWGSQSQYSHGFVVPLFALYLLWARRQKIGWDQPQGSWWGVAILVLGLGLRFAGTYLYFDWLAGIALLPCLAGLCVLWNGRRGLHWAWPAIAFLVFMVPMPFRLEVALAHPLQRLATMISTYALQSLGLVAFSEGTVIAMGEVRIGVVEACSGLSMLMIFFALSTAVVILMKRSPLERGVVFLSAIPIALAANIIRIIVTALLHKLVGREIADLVFHDLAGWLMMPLALVFLWIELRLLAWVLVAAQKKDVKQFFGRGWGATGKKNDAGTKKEPVAAGRQMPRIPALPLKAPK